MWTPDKGEPKTKEEKAERERQWDDVKNTIRNFGGIFLEPFLLDYLEFKKLSNAIDSSISVRCREVCMIF